MDTASHLLQLELHLARRVDERLERAVRYRWSIARTVRETLPLLHQSTGALEVLVHTPDDELRPRLFRYPERAAHPTPGIESLHRRAIERMHPLRCSLPEGDFLVYPLAVAGTPLGVAVLRLHASLCGDPTLLERSHSLLRTWCEHLDTFLAIVGLARQRHRVHRELASALRHPILEKGLRQAVQRLAEEVRFDTLVVAWQRAGDTAAPSVLRFEAREGRITGVTPIDGHATDDPYLRAWAADTEPPSSASEVLGRGGHFEEVLIRGVRRQRVLGRLLAGRRDDDFSLHDRELLEVFTDVLAQRVVDLQREWATLSSTFPPATVDALLHEEDYAERWLRPVEREVAILYTDISGFTRICAKTLREPARVATLVDRWSARAVEILWEEGGAFDKMVGDCVIGLWGPPFFDLPPKEACCRAARAAWRIRIWTERMLQDDPVLAGLFPEGHPPLTVSSGLQWTHAAVGRFGPDGDYTAFGEGMNNAARLQGLAAPGEILCMDTFVTCIGEPGLFGAERSAPAKNVPEPLRFRPLQRPPE